MLRSIQRYAQVALLIAGSAILLYSCDKESVAEEPNDEALMTEYSEHLTMTNTENGRKSYVFTAPLVEGYSLAKEPYQEFRKGVDIVTYQKDSTGAVDATLTANYAIHYGNRKLWEAKGNVVVKKSNGQELYTQQLFWNEKTRRIWSNVDSKIVEESGNSYIVEGFESDDQLKDWKFRRIKGRMWVQYRADTGRGFYVGETRCGQCFRCEGGSFRTACQTGPADTGERPENSTDSRRK